MAARLSSAALVVSPLRRAAPAHLRHRRTRMPQVPGRMHLLAVVTHPRHFLTNIGEPTEPPARSPNRGPPYWQSTVLRRSTLGDAA